MSEEVYSLILGILLGWASLAIGIAQGCITITGN